MCTHYHWGNTSLWVRNQASCDAEVVRLAVRNGACFFTHVFETRWVADTQLPKKLLRAWDHGWEGWHGSEPEMLADPLSLAVWAEVQPSWGDNDGVRSRDALLAGRESRAWC